jgi:putative polyhydroxyalkanoate system protein
MKKPARAVAGLLPAALDRRLATSGSPIQSNEPIMPKFNVTVPHPLSQPDARERLNRFADVLGEKFKDQVSDLQQNWEGDTLNFSFKSYGIQLKGGVTVADKQLNVDGELPFTAMMFKGKIESAIKEQLEKLMKG